MRSRISCLRSPACVKPISDNLASKFRRNSCEPLSRAISLRAICVTGSGVFFFEYRVSIRKPQSLERSSQIDVESVDVAQRVGNILYHVTPELVKAISR